MREAIGGSCFDLTALLEYCQIGLQRNSTQNYYHFYSLEQGEFPFEKWPASADFFESGFVIGRHTANGRGDVGIAQL